MPDQTLQETADAQLARAVGERGARDPREECRALLRKLKGRNRGGYERAVSYYESMLVPSVASGQVEPVGAWLDYGRLLASLIAPGRTIEVDEGGAARDCVTPVAPDRLVLHLPNSADLPALAVALPAALSTAQQATFDLLVAGRVTLRSEEAAASPTPRSGA